jgi:hypothetical protein
VGRNTQEHNQERARTQRESTRARPDVTSYGNAGHVETRLPMRTVGERNESESLHYDPIPARGPAISDSYNPHPPRHSSTIGVQTGVGWTPTYIDSHRSVAPGQANPNTSTRPDGYSPRTSSRLLGSSPKDIPPISSRHHAPQDTVRDRDSTLNETSSSFGRTTSRDHHTGYASYGNMNARTAARDLKHNYVQADFPDIFTWERYNLEREQYHENLEREQRAVRVRQSQLRRDDASADESLSDDYSDDEISKPRRSRAHEARSFIPTSSTVRRHDVGYDLTGSGRAQPEPLPKSQMIRSSRQRGERLAGAPLVDEFTFSRRPAQHNEDRYDSPERTSPTPSPPDSTIGHQHKSGSEGLKHSKNPKEDSKIGSKEHLRSVSGSKSRHTADVQQEQHRPTSVFKALIKHSPKDQGRTSNVPSTKSSSRNHADSTSRKSRPGTGRVRSDYGDERGSRRSSDSEEDVIIQSNSRRQRDPEYNERRRHK